MGYSILKGGKLDVKVWVPDLSQVDSQALDQLRRTASLPVALHVLAMADVHAGAGATVGSVVALKGAISPACVGVDIGCGMLWSRTNLVASDLPDSLLALRLDIEAKVPTGFNSHQNVVRDAGSAKLWDDFQSLDRGVRDQLGKARQQCGTLGGGNHFIEIVVDEEQRVGVMLHSGSRAIGKTLADIHIAKAQALGHNAGLPDKDLAYFLAGTPEMAAYRRDLFWAQAYALLNRQTMFRLIQEVLRRHFPQVYFEETVQCHHNYVAEEIHFGNEVLVTRKGAIKAGLGDMGIIPSSMGCESYIVRGRGNPESLNSASHGAGRRMSRSKAKKTITLEEFIESTKGVECRKDIGMLDEAPGAYKPIAETMANQADLIEIVHRVKQVLCVKGGEKSNRKGAPHEE